MRNRFSPTRLLPVLAAAATLAFAASGCGTSSADTDRGAALFNEKCGTCHKLAHSGSAGVAGPDLDAAFAAARESGQSDSTIEGVIKAQVLNPRPAGKDAPAFTMPANIVTGQDLNDVAAYIALWAGVPGAAPAPVEGGPGAQVFASNGCAACHTLAAAEAGGTVGPNLDEFLPGQTPEMIHTSIVDPDAEIPNGYSAGVMPTNYGSLISEEELDELVKFLVKSTKGGGSK